MTSMFGNHGLGTATGAGTIGTATGKNIIPKGYRHGQIGQFTPEQIQLFQSMFGQLGPDSFLGRLAGGNQSQFEQMEKPALRQFGQLQGGLASRFSGMGMGARRGSGFQNAANQQAADFAERLQANRLGLQQNAVQQMSQMAQMLMGQRPYEQFLAKKDMPFWKQLLLGLMNQGGEMAHAAAQYGTSLAGAGV